MRQHSYLHTYIHPLNMEEQERERERERERKHTCTHSYSTALPAFLDESTLDAT